MLFDRINSGPKSRMLCAVVLLPLLYLAPALADANSAEPLLRNKVTLKASFWGVSETNGIVAAVGLKGRTGFSPDGDRWHTHVPGKGTHLFDVAGSDAGSIVVGGKGFTSGQGIVFKAGPRFESLAEIAQAEAPLYDIGFVDPLIGHAVGASGTLLRTEDGGRSWAVQSPGTNENLWAVKFISNTVGLVGGGATPWQNSKKSSGIILRTTDGGRSWQTVYESKNRVSDFSFVNGKLGFASGVGGVILKTEDGGKSWKSAGATPLKTIVNALAFTDENCGLIVGAGGTAYLTRDGGDKWSEKVVVTHGSFLEALAPSIRKPGAYWVVGGDGTIGLIDLNAFCRKDQK